MPNRVHGAITIIAIQLISASASPGISKVFSQLKSRDVVFQRPAMICSIPSHSLKLAVQDIIIPLQVTSELPSLLERKLLLFQQCEVAHDPGFEFFLIIRRRLDVHLSVLV